MQPLFVGVERTGRHRETWRQGLNHDEFCCNNEISNEIANMQDKRATGAPFLQLHNANEYF